ncbi:MAG: hypothetical protein ACLP9L_20035, partial [Thermoguttaceae bacterium]
MPAATAGQRNSPPCLAVQVVERVLQGLRFGQEFAAASVICARLAAGIAAENEPICFRREVRQGQRTARRSADSRPLTVHRQET